MNQNHVISTLSTFWLLLTCCPCLCGGDESPSIWEQAQELSPGIQYIHVERDSPRLMVVNCLKIDTQTPHLRLITTPRRDPWEPGKAETTRQTVRNFIRRSQDSPRQIVVAVNADAFSPWPAPPQAEDPTDLNGLAISSGVLVSKPTGTPSLLVLKSGQLRIETVPGDRDLSDVEAAVSGFSMCLNDGEVVAGGDDLHPRTGYGLSRDERYLFLMTIDGRQAASLGATVPEVGQLLKDFGADDGINMDGGGSTTMAWWNPKAPEADRCQLLNHPVGLGKSAAVGGESTPAERANGNNLGVYYLAP